MRWIAGLLAVLALVGCKIPEQPNAADSMVAVSLDKSETLKKPNAVEFGFPLRLAVLWTTESAYVVTHDQAVDTLPYAPMVPLSVPSAVPLLALVPRERMRVGRSTTTDVYRLRFVAYEDRDHNGVLDPTLLHPEEPAEPPEDGTQETPSPADSVEEEDPSKDRVVGVDGAITPSVGLILDLDAMLENLSLEQTEAYYQSTNQRYTAFVRVRTSTNLEMVLGSISSPVDLRLTDSPVPQTQLRCKRQRVAVYEGLQPAERVAFVLDTALQDRKNAICGYLFADCRTKELNSLGDETPNIKPPKTDVIEYEHQCRKAKDLGSTEDSASSGLEFLLLHEAIRICKACSCWRRQTATIYVAKTGSTPDWWPCGTELDWCESTLPLHKIAPECILPEDDEEEET